MKTNTSNDYGVLLTQTEITALADAFFDLYMYVCKGGSYKAGIAEAGVDGEENIEDWADFLEQFAGFTR